MRRSEINGRIRDAIDLFEQHRFFLPPFAHWAPEDWPMDADRVREIVDRGLGWDVTDFGEGRFDELGLLLFTLRNGRVGDEVKTAVSYAEKVMIVNVDQVTPMHHHWSKTEDIINRGGGRLMIKLHAVGEADALSEGDVEFSADGIRYREPAGHIVCLSPGESITLTPGLYHSFWAEGERVLAGEVSSVNDDEHDNRFLEPLGRFPAVDEDEPPFRLLVSDYDAHLRR
jgi:D-lyxose ketol-isomerase